MAATNEQLEARVAFLERELRRAIVIIDNLEARTDTRLAGIDQHLHLQDATQQEVVQQVVGVSEQVSAFAVQVKAGFESTDKRFEHVYGALADVNANTVEIRNILATLVEQQKGK
ncbi:MAG: hypothetical protein ACRDHW_14550 [Ktedonobacteraceae bacterium]